LAGQGISGDIAAKRTNAEGKQPIRGQLARAALLQFLVRIEYVDIGTDVSTRCSDVGHLDLRWSQTSADVRKVVHLESVWVYRLR
jgi:hypothetical protein